MADPSFWSIALPTTAGAVVGAGVGVLGIRWQFHRESRERYGTQLTNRLFQINEEMRAIIPRSANSGRNLVTEVWNISVSLKNISMMANSADRELISLLSDACTQSKSFDLVEVNNLFFFLIETITGWRNQTKSFDYYLEQLKARIKEK